MKIDISPYSECFIVAGGPSLREFDWTLLDSKFVMAVNRAYEVLPNAQIVYFTDNDWWQQHKKALLAHKGHKCKGSLINKMLKHPNVTDFELTGPEGLDMTPGKLKHGYNSAYACINLAVQLGFKKIYLLGLDMRWEKDDKGSKKASHWHSGHKRVDPESVYKKNITHYKTIVEPLKKLNIEVFNVSPRSALDLFPKLSFADVFDSYNGPSITEESMSEEKLLGDRVEQVLDALGGKQIAKAIERVTRKPCNCAKRKEALNNMHRNLARNLNVAKIEPVPPPVVRQPLKPRLIPRAPAPVKK